MSTPLQAFERTLDYSAESWKSGNFFAARFTRDGLTNSCGDRAQLRRGMPIRIKLVKLPPSPLPSGKRTRALLKRPPLVLIKKAFPVGNWKAGVNNWIAL